jgi:hypothetical protein
MQVLGVRGGRKVWKCARTGRLFTWDSLHGEIEVFDRQGYHLGVMDAKGRLTKQAKKGRKLDV